MSTATRSYKTGKIRIDNLQRSIEAAEFEFAHQGFKGASIMSIANRSGLPRPNVHYYFKNKSELYSRIIMDTLALWNDVFGQISEDDDPADALGAYIRAKVMYSKTNPLGSKIFANEIIHGAPHLGDYLSTDFRDWLQLKSRVIQSWVDQGKMDPVNPLYLIFLIWSSTQHYADFSIQVTSVLGKEQLSDRDFDEIAEDLVHIILKGCGLSRRNGLS